MMLYTWCYNTILGCDLRARPWKWNVL